MVKTIIDYWYEVNEEFTFGKDYISLETTDYLIICPFNPQLMVSLNCKLRWFHFTHCTTDSFDAFKYWYSNIYKDGMLKCFFIKKDIDLHLSWYQQPSISEFTGWLDFSHKGFLYFCHDVKNKLLSGKYERNDDAWWNIDSAMEECVTDGRRKTVFEYMNNIATSVFDELFAMYDRYIDGLEETLHNSLENIT